MNQKKRTFRQVLRDLPGDWLLERSRVPADIITLATLFGSALLGVPAGQVMAFTLAASKIPFAANLARAAYHRDWSYWTRPQAHQPVDIAEKPLPPMESDPDAKGVPGWLRWLTKSAEQKHKVAMFLDDWLNTRSRVPAFVIEASVLLFGLFVAPIPWVVLFPINALVSAVPSILGAYLAIRNHDVQRWTRGGNRQRGELLRQWSEREAGGQEMILRGRAAIEAGTPAPVPRVAVPSAPIARVVAAPRAPAPRYVAKGLPARDGLDR